MERVVRTNSDSDMVGRTLRSLGRWLVHLSDRVMLWRERALQRKLLSGFDDRALRDIAIDRATAYDEAAKPFWRD